MSVDPTKMKKDDEITVKDGRKLKIRNVYMGTEGIMVIAKGSTSGPLVDQNFLLADVTDHKEKKEK
jgi:hypothetical protein